MDLSIVTVTWNSNKLIGKQIRSVREGCRTISYEHIIIDNASSDNTGELIRTEFSEVLFIQNRKNIGFGAANNAGAHKAKGEFILFLNPDMRVSPGSLDIMVTWMREHPEVGLASCLLTDENGKPHPEAQPRRFPGFIDQLATIFHAQGVAPKAFERYMFNEFDPNKEQMVDSIRGSFMVMRREVYEKLGWAFDPRFYIWFEDVDICREVWRLGYTVMHTPVISCIDMVGQSFKKRTSFWKHKQFTESMVIYFKKWEPIYKWLPLMCARYISLPIAWVAAKAK